MRRNSFIFVFLIYLLSTLTITPSAQAAQPPDGEILVEFVSVTGISLEALSEGEAGAGYLLYYLPERGVEQPSLVVHLEKEAGAKKAIANIYDALSSDKNIVGAGLAPAPQLDESLTPRITIEALDGWWVRDDLVNYNLDIQINGPMFAMWGAAYEPKFGGDGWSVEVQMAPERPTVSIQVRDPTQTGLPQWELRQLLPAFSGRGYYRTNYAERKCETATEIDLGISPLWPYISDALILSEEENGFEQRNGYFHPPIVVDWEAGQITHFSELVTVRNQNCSYSLYSINSLRPDELNQANFETPFAFYDLSGEGQGYPNLLLRTERFAKNDPWSVGIDPKVQQNRRAPRDIEWIRYSWRNEVGDGLWDYKIEVLGFHPYTDETAIADGWASIDAPPYEAFPNWVIEKEWPVVTFIDTEGTPYPSQEGIYEWAPRAVGIGYLFGWQDTSNPQPFESIREGLRGEYRSQKSLQPKLYLSPIDQRLHLLGAEGGLWNLGKGEVIRLHNLDGDLYLDGWTRERIVGAGASPAPTSAQIEEALYSLEGYLLYGGDGEVVIRESSHEPSLGELLPPSDQASWRAFGEEVGAREVQEESISLKKWFDTFRGRTIRITKGQLSEVRTTAKGFRFVLELQEGFKIRGSERLFPLAALGKERGNANQLEVGQYEISYDGEWHISPLTPPALSIDVEFREPEDDDQEPLLTLVQVSNSGTEEAKGLTFIAEASFEGKSSGIINQPLDVLESTQLILNWQPDSAGSWTLNFSLLDADEHVVAETSRSITIKEEETNQARVLAVSTNNGQRLLSYLLILAFGLLIGLIWHRQEPLS